MMGKNLFALFLIVFSASVSFAQTSPFLGELKKGGFAVGYKIFQKKDFARAARPKNDFRGKPFEGERARTINFAIWYPATVEKNAKPMIYEDYLLLSPLPTAVPDARKKQIRDGFKAAPIAAGIAAEKLDSVLAMPTEAFYNAVPVEQKFPLVVGANMSRSLAEYLASNGYVVAHVAGGRSDFFYTDALQDLEFALNELQSNSQIDFSKIGAVGFSFAGGMASLLQMKTNNIDAVVSYDGIEAWTQMRDLENLPYFRPENANVPYLRFHDSQNAAANLDFALFYDRARFMNYTQIDYKDLGHRAADGAILNHLLPNFDGANPKNSIQHHRLLGEYTLGFLDANLKKDEKAAAFLKRTPEENGYAKDFVAIKRKEALPRPPSLIESAEVIDREGIEAFLKINQELKTKQPKPFAAPVLTSLLLQYSGRNQPKIVLALANLLVETHPEISASWFNAAFNLQRTGETATAIKYFEKFLEVEKNDTATPAATKERMRRTTLETLETLKKKAS